MLFEIINYVYDCIEEICSVYAADSIQSSWISCECAYGYYWNGYWRNGTYDLRSEKNLNIILWSLLLSTLFGRKDEYIAQLIQVWKTVLHIHCVVGPADVQFCNPPSKPLYLKSSKFSKEFFEGTGTADITLHNKRTFLSNTLKHIHKIKHCVYKSEKYGKIRSFWIKSNR